MLIGPGQGVIRVARPDSRPLQFRHIESISEYKVHRTQSFARSLQRGVTAHVSIMDVPSEFREIRLAAYLKRQSK